MFPEPIRIHGREFSDYTHLTDFIRIKYPKEHSQYWEQCFPNENFVVHYNIPVQHRAMAHAMARENMAKTKSNFNGFRILFTLGVLQEPSFPSESAGSNEGSPPETPIDIEFRVLERAFSSVYIDPHGFAEDVFDTLLSYMKCYCSDKGLYVAPYSSLITSSMMGKSRLLKQIADRTPLIYICLRYPRSTGYPKRSSPIAAWLLKDLKLSLKDKSMLADDSNFLGTLKFSVFFEATLDQLVQFISTGDLPVTAGDFSWLWKFLAEPTDPSKLERFWRNVIENAESMLYEICFDKKRNTYLPQNANNYLKWTHPHQVSEKLELFWQSVTRFGFHNKTLPFLFVFDEARSLCETDTNGLPVLENYSKYQETPTFPKDKETPGEDQFPWFKVGLRALRYLSNKDICPEVARIFGIFTDTTSRTTNFQPTSWDESSGRFTSLPDPGKQQFPPIYLFASIDVYSRLHNIQALSHPEKVTTIPRLLKFGRAGWYSIYQQTEACLARQASKSSSAKEIKPRDSVSTLIRMAIEKLRNSSQDLVDLPTKPKEFLQHLAVLSPRLALTIGPYNIEAAELVGSHLAVVGGTDDERHFLRTYYPSEPFLAEVSALCTKSKGWHGPLKALIHYVMGGVVEAGFRGELLTKLTCLMAMDYLLDSKEMEPLPSDQLRFSRAVRVSQFLNALITPRTGNTFCEILHGVTPEEPFSQGTLNVDESKLQTFLNGYVFFNHFIRVEVKLTIPMLVQAWNRGAAIMCKTGTKGIDYVIPIVLPERGDKHFFGPLHDEWTNEQCKAASRRVSYILINSRNYEAPKKQFAAAWAAKFSSKNLESCQKAKITRRPETVEQLLTQVDDAENEDEDEGSDDENEFGPDCPVANFDELDMSWNPDEFEAKEAKRREKMQIDKPDEIVESTGNVFLSLVQDFGNKSKKEHPVSIGEILPEFSQQKVLRSRTVMIKPKPNPITQFIVVLKGIGPDTYRFLRDDVIDSQQLGTTSTDLELTRRYLKELRRTRYDYVENRRQLMAKFKGHKPIEKSLEAIVEGLPLVYNSDQYTSEAWNRSSSQLQQSEQDMWRQLERESD